MSSCEMSYGLLYEQQKKRCPWCGANKIAAKSRCPQCGKKYPRSGNVELKEKKQKAVSTMTKCIMGLAHDFKKGECRCSRCKKTRLECYK